MWRGGTAGGRGGGKGDGTGRWARGGNEQKDRGEGGYRHEKRNNALTWAGMFPKYHGTFSWQLGSINHTSSPASYSLHDRARG